MSKRNRIFSRLEPKGAYFLVVYREWNILLLCVFRFHDELKSMIEKEHIKHERREGDESHYRV